LWRGPRKKSCDPADLRPSDGPPVCELGRIRTHRAFRVTVLLAACALAAAGGSRGQSFAVVSIVNSPTIAGRAVALDEQAKLLPWPMPRDIGYSYSDYFLSQWTILWDQYHRQRLPYYYCCFDIERISYEMRPEKHWANSTGYLRAMMQGFIERLYPYTGDPRTLEFLQNFVDYELDFGRTPRGYAWAQVPYPSANPGSRRYTGWSTHGEDYVEPHVVGEDGYAYLRLYEMTGDRKYLRAALRCAEALVRNYRKGNAQSSPWPYRCFAKSGSIAGGKGMFRYSANVLDPIQLLDELIRLGQGNLVAFKAVRNGAWQWLMQYPMRNNRWVGYFEDVQASMANMNQVIPLEFARYALLHPGADPDWREHARKLIEWVKTTPKWPKYLVHGALVTTEQGDGKEYCCNPPPQCCDSHSARLAAVEALYYAKTGDAAYKEQAYRTFNFVSYFQGLPGDAHAPFFDQWWFTDEFADGPRRMMDAFWAVPEWAPADESHLLGSEAVVTSIAYGAGRVRYSTFDADSTDVLRLDFAPDSITADGVALGPRSDLTQDGFIFDADSRTLYIRHTNAKDIEIRGSGGHPALAYVTFDDPHLLAGTRLPSRYPAGLMHWDAGQWQIGVPQGKFGTFNLLPANNQNGRAAFHFDGAQIFAGIDVYNAADHEATLVLSAPASPARRVTIKPRELRRIRTEWREPDTEVSLELTDGGGLVFDNLAYAAP
jgi:hypothetical protein